MPSSPKLWALQSTCAAILPGRQVREFFDIYSFLSEVSQKKLGKRIAFRENCLPYLAVRAAQLSDKQNMLLFFSLSKEGRGKQRFAKAKTSQQLL